MEKVIKKVIWLIMAIPAVYLVLAWQHLPEQVTLHFDWSGKPDKLGSRNELLWTVILLVAVTAVVYLILTNIYRIDPKRNAADNKSRLLKMGAGLVIFLTVLQCLIIYSATHGNIRFNSGIFLAATGLFFAFLGNYMHNIKPNYFAGFRLPWTLENEENWRKTHALVGKLWFGGGLFLAILSLFLPPRIGMVVFFSVMIIITIIPVVFSYRLFIQQKRSSAIK